MKKCSTCNETKSLEDFHKRSSSKDGHQNVCKTCNKEQRKAYYKTAHGRERNLTTGKRARHALTDRLIAYLKEHPCVDCGESDIVVLDFDHLANKSMGISVMVRRGFSWEKILAEISKCEVRCANCHRRKTARQFDWRRLGA